MSKESDPQAGLLHAAEEEGSPFRGWFAVRVALPLVVIVAGLGLYAFIQPGTLATRKIEHNGQTLRFQLLDRAGQVSAQVRGEGTTTVSLGASDALDTRDAEILLDESTRLVILRVGESRMTYDLETRTFISPAIP